MLSNTAVPRYYGEFRDAVVRGEIPVNEFISMEMNRIDKLISDPSIYYDVGAVEGFIKFCENELTLTDGSPLRLVPSFKLWAEELFGWFYFTESRVYSPIIDDYETKIIKNRLINKQYLIVGRGAAKTLYDTCVQAYELVCDTMTTSQITTAPTLKQAEEVLSPLRTAMSRARGPVFKFMTEGSSQNTRGNPKDRQKLVSTKDGIVNSLTNSIIKPMPMRIDKLQGLRCKVATVDEWLSGDTKEDPIMAIQQGAAKNPNYIILSTSSEGTVRNGVGDSIKLKLIDILKGEYSDIHTSIFYYRLDDIREISNPRLWVKANPNLGYTVSYDTYQQEVDEAEHSPSTRNDIIAKRFGIPSEGFTYFFTYEETLVHLPESYDGMCCSLGMDLSQGDDFCAFTFLFPLPGGAFGIKTRSYITELTYDRLPIATKQKYDDFRAEGALVVMGGTVLDMDNVYDDLDDLITERGYVINCNGYDPYNAEHFIDRWSKEYGSYGTVKVPQGARTETVPLGELKKLASERLLIFDESLMSYCMGNAIALEDTNGNRKLLKKRRSEKIDNVSALLDAWVAYKDYKDDF